MQVIKKEFVYLDSKSAPECHASTVVKLRNGETACAFFAGSKEGKDDVCIYFAKTVDCKWTKAVKVTPDDGVPHWNPVLMEMNNGELWLFYKVGKPIADWITYYKVSLDYGESWSDGKMLVDGDESGGRGPVKNKPIYASSGVLLAPASVERGAWRCFIDEFDGKTWTKRPIPVAPTDENINFIQPTLWENPNGVIHALMRSSGGSIYRSDSLDNGKTWSTAYKIAIPNNNSGLDCVVTQSGMVALVCNPIEKNWGARVPLSLFVSYDNGETFTKALDLETEQGEWEFSCPAIIADGNRLMITYTYKRRGIVYCEVKL